MNKLRKQKLKLHSISPYCENCGILTVLSEHCEGVKYSSDGLMYFESEPPGNMATIQHAYDRLHYLRKVQSDIGRRRFLWCHDCNKRHHKLYEEPRNILYLEKINNAHKS